ncbi:SCO family protein [Arcticibacter svalbardensis]|nr:SCO family protein [Arcticibacter svalbardensis]
MKYIISLICLSVLISCKENRRKLPYYDTADFTPKWEMKDPKTFHAIRKFNLINQEGMAFTEKNLDGKICVADFFFTSCPGICPKLAISMSALQKEFLEDKDVLLVSHSVTPATDSVPVLKQYAEAHGVNPKKWNLLTGNKDEIYDLGRKFYYVEEDLGLKSDASIFLHTENFVLIDKQRHIRGIYNGLDPNSMLALKNDIKELKKEE